MALPAVYALGQNYPNPFNPTTTIRYDLPEAGHVVLNVFNISGQLVRTLVDDWIEAGHHRAEWDGRDEHDREVAAGIYLYRLVIEKDKLSMVRRMVFLK